MLFKVADLEQVWQSNKELQFFFPFNLFWLPDENLVKISVFFSGYLPSNAADFFYSLSKFQFVGNVKIS